jgi:arsenate reductase
MAEGILRDLSSGSVEVFSAGTEPTRVHPLAVQTLKELGIDISNQRSKGIDEFTSQTFDVVITLCDSARESCPTLPGDPERIHWSFPDPAAAEGTEAERLAAFRQVARELTTRLRPSLSLIQRATQRSPA